MLAYAGPPISSHATQLVPLRPACAVFVRLRLTLALLGANMPYCDLGMSKLWDVIPWNRPLQCT